MVSTQIYVLTGLVAVPIYLNFIVIYTENNARILPNWDSKIRKSYCVFCKIYSKRKNLILHEVLKNVCRYAISV